MSTQTFALLGTATITTSDVQMLEHGSQYHLEVEFPNGNKLELLSSQTYDMDGIGNDYIKGRPKLNVGDQVEVIKFNDDEFGAVVA